jgi:hypothetical protein
MNTLDAYSSRNWGTDTLKNAARKPQILIGIGATLAIVFGFMSMSTGMWGCGAICQYLIVAFWMALGIVIYGVWLVVKNKKFERS